MRETPRRLAALDLFHRPGSVDTVPVMAAFDGPESHGAHRSGLVRTSDNVFEICPGRVQLRLCIDNGRFRLNEHALLIDDIEKTELTEVIRELHNANARLILFQHARLQDVETLVCGLVSVKGERGLPTDGRLQILALGRRSIPSTRGASGPASPRS